jgi:hypothetical protein
MEEDMLVVTLKILPHAYDKFIETLNIVTTDVDLKFGELCNNILQQDRWKKQFGSSSEIKGSKQVFEINVKGKDKWEKKNSKGNGEDETKRVKTIACH